MYICNLLRKRRHFQFVFRNSRRCISTTTYKYSKCLDNVQKPEGWEQALSYESIPGPKPIPVLGNTWLFLPIVGPLYKINFADLPNTLYMKYGKIFRLGSLPVPDTVFICDPIDIEMVFRKEGMYPIRDVSSKTFGYYRDNVRYEVFQGVPGIFVAQDKRWHNIRSEINQIFLRPQTMFQYIEGIDSITNALLTRIRHFAQSNQNREMPDDFINSIHAWALEAVAYIAIDKRLGCLNLYMDNNSESLEIIENVFATFQLYEELQFRPSYRNIYKTKKWKRFVQVQDFLTSVFLKYIKESESQLIETNQKSKSVLQQLLKLDKRLAIAMALDMLIAGVDTTGKQIANILYYLAKHQEAQDTLRKELFSLLPTKESPFTKDCLLQASYLKAVIKETERIAPIASGTSRKTVKDMVLSGYQIPKGTNITTCNNIASKLQEHYPQPLEFLPERWLRSTKGELSYRNAHSFATLPFGFGPRSCVGKRIAKLEMEIGIARMIRNFRVMWHHKEPKFQGLPLIGIADPLKFQFNEIDR